MSIADFVWASQDSFFVAYDPKTLDRRISIKNNNKQNVVLVEFEITNALRMGDSPFAL